MIQEFATHLTRDVKQLVEDKDTGAQTFRYVRTGTNHYSFAFTYDCIAWSRDRSVASPGRMVVCTGDAQYRDSIRQAEW